MSVPYSHLVLFDIDGTLVRCGPTPRLDMIVPGKEIGYG
jgi:hypothetical protein